MSDDTVTMNVRGLEQLLRALKVKQPVARIGVLGTNTARKAKEGEKDALNNAEIGAIYEYNIDPHRPGGSFLRIPINDHLDKALSKSGALDPDTFAQVIKQGTILPWLTKVAIIAKDIVLGAFATTGYGKWKASNMARKKNHQTLVETKQLRDSITYEVKA